MFSPQRMKKHLAFALAVSLVAMVPVSAFAQVLKISMTKTNVSIENVLRELEKQSDTERDSNASALIDDTEPVKLAFFCTP